MKHAVSEEKLSSWAKLLAIDMPNTSSFALSIFVRSGYRFTQEGQYDLPHLLEHLAFEGNTIYPSSKKFAYAMEKYGIQYNANTDNYLNEYAFVGSIENLSTIVKFAIGQITGPLFREKDIEQEKKTIENEFHPHIVDVLPGYVWRSLIESTLPSHESRISMLKNIKKEDILEFYRKYYVSRNFFFVMGGDISGKIEKVRQCIDQSLSDYPQGETAQYEPMPLLDYGRKIQMIDSQQKATNFFVGFTIPEIALAESFALTVINVLYNRWRASRMHKAREKGLSYGISSGYDHSVDYSDFYVADSVKKENITPLFRLCMKELAAIRKGNFTQKEFERAKGFISGGYRRGIDSPENIVDYYGRAYALRLDTRTMDELHQNTLSVTQEDILRVAEKYFRPENWSVVLKGNNLGGMEKDILSIMDQNFLPIA